MKRIAVKMLVYFVTFFQIVSDRILEFVLGWYWGPKKTCPPLTKDTFLTKSAVELATMIREQKIKSYEVVKAYIGRMREINPVINAVVEGPFEEALEEARKIDERISKGQISEDEFSEKPFLGVPFTSKDSTAVKGKLYTLGLVSRRNYRAEEDAEIVRLCKEAGGIVIATSNVPEVNKWTETRNNLIGQTNNPYDIRRSVGGSSGGEASLIASCATAFGLGTDIGGSTRIPAFSCGVFGHKATSGIVNMKGITMRKGNEGTSMVAAGPMSRYATDLLPLFKVFIGPKKAAVLKLDEPVNIKSLKYFYVPENRDIKGNPISRETQAVMTKVIQHFGNITGRKVILAQLPGLNKSSNLWRYWMTLEPTNYYMTLGNGVALNPVVEIMKKLLGQSDFTLAAIYLLIDTLLPKENATKMKELTEQLKTSITDLLGEDGVLFYHSSPRTAPFHYYPFFKFYDFHYFSIFNVLHFPATQVPMGLDSNGMPLGIQVVASKTRDRHCLAVAEELERAFGGWVAPFTMSNSL